MNRNLTASELMEKGKEAYQRGVYEEAATYFEAAGEKYRLSGDELLAAEAANNCGVVWLKLGKFQSALDILQGTDVVFANAGDKKCQGMALGNRACALEALGLFDDALACYEEAANVLKEAGDTETRFYLMQAFSQLQLRTRRQLQALGTLRAGLNGVNKPSLKQRLVKKILDIPLSLLKGE